MPMGDGANQRGLSRKHLFEEIEKDLQEAHAYGPRNKRAFLCDGDALILPTKRLLAIRFDQQVHVIRLDGELHDPEPGALAHGRERNLQRVDRRGPAQ